jgi:hypothetical protein
MTRKFLTILVVLLWRPGVGAAQALGGMTGLVTVPIAEVAPYGDVSFGGSLLDRKYNEYWPGRYHQAGFFASMGYLPFLEASLRITRSYRAPKTTSGLGDRMASFRLRLFDERGRRPAVAVGVNDVFSALESSNAIRHNALYAAATRHWRKEGSILRWGAHAGYGADRFRARHHEFVGPFGGLSLDAGPRFTGMIEYDARKFNAGVRMEALGHVRVLVALMHMDAFAGSVCCHFPLEP